MWRVTSQNKRHKEWVEERKKQIDEEYKDRPLDVGWKDILAMIIAAFQVLTPVFFLVAIFITLVFVGFNFLLK
ncbi:hypothetical protein [Paramaledivibacter caminithermalis]|uniref:hypothetical protein n=1 Tax=Paramaledivibacter caminithermalis TaxID=191027 RepID=UPI0009335A1C|nr:hypothetical protein [Paramaledivibacter caminithermalis]